jgi:integrase
MIWLLPQVVRLDPGDTKNDEGRILYLNEELKALMHELFRSRNLGCPYVFQRDGKQIKESLRYSWDRACQATGMQERLFHDFRRTAVRNMVRAGIPEGVAMKISGHKTRSVFERYNIVNEQDFKEAALKQQLFVEAQKKSAENDVGMESLVPFQQAANA